MSDTAQSKILPHARAELRLLHQKRQDGEILSHARAELRLLHQKRQDGEPAFFADHDRMVAEAVLDLLRCFAGQRHSGASAAMVLDIFDRLVHYSGASAAMVLDIFDRLVHWKPLMPLTGDDDEWEALDPEQAGPDTTHQNKRCSSVFKDAAGSAWDVNAIAYCDEQGVVYQPGGLRSAITFPYTPPTSPRLIAERKRQDGDEGPDADGD